MGLLNVDVLRKILTREAVPTPLPQRDSKLTRFLHLDSNLKDASTPLGKMIEETNHTLGFGKKDN